MSSPNEPGYPPRTGDGPGSANGSPGASPDAGPPGGGPGRNGPAKESGEAPPWQRGAAARPRQASRGVEGQEGPRAGSAAGHPPGADARLNRFVSGGPGTPPPSGPNREPGPAREGGREGAPQGDGPRGERPEPPRSEPTRPETYASELPDLSGGQARQGPRKPPAERPASEAPSARPAGRTQVAGRTAGPVRASMQIRRFDPWSVLKVSLVLSVALFFVWMIAVAFLYLVLGGMGVWSKLNSNVGDLLTSASGSGGELVSSGTIFGGAALIGLVNIVLLTAMATCAAFIYNLTTDLVGGVEVTLADRD